MYNIASVPISPIKDEDLTHQAKSLGTGCEEWRVREVH